MTYRDVLEVIYKIRGLSVSGYRTPTHFVNSTYIITSLVWTKRYTGRFLTTIFTTVNLAQKIDACYNRFGKDFTGNFFATIHRVKSRR